MSKVEKQTATSLASVVGPAAVIECNRDFNGQLYDKKGRTLYDYTGGVSRTKNGVETEVSEDAFISPFVYKYTFRLDEKPVLFSQLKDLDPMLRVTKGMYMIKYVSKNSKDRKKGHPWKIGQDLVRWDVRVSGPKEWHELCNRIPEFKWIEQNSTLTDEMFGFAARHANMAVWFSVDWVKYEEKLKPYLEKAKKEDILENRKSSVEEYKKIKKKVDKTLLIRSFNDVFEQITEVENIPSVQEEMSENAELYIRKRNTKRDPITGRFLKHTEEDREE